MKPDIKLYYVIPVIFFVILIIILLIIPLKKKDVPSQIPTSPPLPTRIQIEVDNNPVNNLKNNPPTFIQPDFTGAVKDQSVPEEETNLASQKKDLRDKTPLNQPTFTIMFDYANDRFTVSLNEPKVTSRDAFDQWLKANYTAIPLDRFEFK